MVQSPSSELPVLIIGKGSIGVRHAEALAELGRGVQFVSRREDAGDHRSIREALSGGGFACAAVTTETARHCTDLAELAERGFAGPVLVEKPVGAFPTDLDIPLPEGPIYVGYNLRFSPVVQALRTALESDRGAVVAAHLHVGQLLSTWRPGRERDSCYSSFRDQGGGVLRDLSHELDLASWLFGPVSAVTARGGRYTEQNIDSDDAWSILIECRGCPQVVVTLNGIDHPPRRTISVTTTKATFAVDTIAGTLRIGESESEYPSERNLSYRLMWEALLTDTPAGSGDLCSWAEGVSTLALITACEKAAEERRWISMGLPNSGGPR